MTDKDIKDYCKNCDVEPPAMRFKCPECEHNPDNENNFVEDINVPHKEQIIIDGVNVGGCKYLNTFSDCDGYHYYCDLADDIKNEYCEYYKDCYYKQLKRAENQIVELNKKVEVKTQEYEELKAYAQRQENQREIYYKEFLKLSQECEELKKKLKFKVQENIKLSKENRNLKNWAHIKGVEIKVNRKIKETNLEEFCRLFQFKEIQAREKKLKEWQDFENDLQWKFYENCKQWTSMRDERDRYRKALEKIEKYCEEQNLKYDTTACMILDIINKAKEE